MIYRPLKGPSSYHKGVSKNQGPPVDPNSRALILRTPAKRSPNLRKQPYMYSTWTREGAGSAHAPVDRPHAAVVSFEQEISDIPVDPTRPNRPK